MKYKILVVDDEEIIRELIKDYLENEYIVEVVGTGEKALEILSKDNNFHVIITDIKLPGISGIELLKKIKEKKSFIQVIIITGYPSLESTIKCVESGANYYILKPFRMDEIKTTVKNSIDRLKRWENTVEET